MPTRPFVQDKLTTFKLTLLRRYYCYPWPLVPGTRPTPPLVTDNPLLRTRNSVDDWRSRQPIKDIIIHEIGCPWSSSCHFLLLFLLLYYPLPTSTVPPSILDEESLWLSLLRTPTPYSYCLQYSAAAGAEGKAEESSTRKMDQSDSPSSSSSSSLSLS